jgi:hypothetical protein
MQDQADSIGVEATAKGAVAFKAKGTQSEILTFSKWLKSRPIGKYAPITEVARFV